MQYCSLQYNPRIKTAGRNINNLRYTDDTTIMAESEELIPEEWRDRTKASKQTNKQQQQQKQFVDVIGDGSKVWCYKEQYCIGTWNAGSMNQDKLEVVKKEMARVNVDILGISELKLECVTLAQMTIISTPVGRNPLEETE